jgi:hypothetical protein
MDHFLNDRRRIGRIHSVPQLKIGIHPLANEARFQALRRRIGLLAT